MRMFVAIDLDDRAKAAVANAQHLALSAVTRRATADGRSSLTLANPRQAHLTLAFLGDILPPQTGRIIAAMQEPIGEVSPFRMSLGGLGIFPPRGAPRVLWLGLSEGALDVTTLQQAVARRLEALGVSLEVRAFHPHLTIGRWKRARPAERPPLQAEVRRPSTRSAAMTVDRVTLYESRLSSEGPVHIALAHALLTP